MRFEKATRSRSVTIIAHRTFITIALHLTIAITGSTCAGDEERLRTRLHGADQMWVINTRGISHQVCSANLDYPRLRVSQFQCGAGLMQSETDHLISTIASDPACVNVIYIHGNRFDRNDAWKRVWTVYHKIRSRCPQDIRMRWILWTWPADPMGGPIKDVRTKAPRADTQTLYAGWFLRRLHASQSDCQWNRVHIIGYSFGGRVATGCLHTAAGGSIGRRSLSGQPLLGARIHVNLIAPALDQHWLRSGSNHGMASQNLGSLNLFYNNRDRVLRLYSMISRVYNPVALGFRGLNGLADRNDGLPIAVQSKNCAGSVGLMHDELKYYEPCCSASRQIASSIIDNAPRQPIALEISYSDSTPARTLHEQTSTSR